MLIEKLASQIIQETKRRICDEGINRIRKCMDQLSLEETWYRPNENSNSVGNLILHLCGNVRQWIIATLGDTPDSRERQQEFDEKGPIPTPELLQKLDTLETDLIAVLDQLDATALETDYKVQGFTENGTAILIHVVEHFSYHVGQITYFVKMKKNLDIGYYEEQDLDVTD